MSPNEYAPRLPGVEGPTEELPLFDASWFDEVATFRPNGPLPVDPEFGHQLQFGENDR